MFPRPFIWRLTSFSLHIWPSVCPLDHDSATAASIAALASAVHILSSNGNSQSRRLSLRH